MRVVVGPVAVSSARAWLGYAREVLDELDSLAPGECVASDEVISIFEAYVEEWEREATGTQFLWDADLPAEQVEYHVHAFQKVVSILAERADRLGASQAPPESEEFYAALLRGVLSALEVEGDSHAAFAMHLEEFWPGREQPIR